MSAFHVSCPSGCLAALKIDTWLLAVVRTLYSCSSKLCAQAQGALCWNQSGPELALLRAFPCPLKTSSRISQLCLFSPNANCLWTLQFGMLFHALKGLVYSHKQLFFNCNAMMYNIEKNVGNIWLRDVLMTVYIAWLSQPAKVCHPAANLAEINALQFLRLAVWCYSSSPS